MKTIKYIAAVIMAAFTMNVSAQSFIVYGTDGSKTEFQTENVSRIEFVEGTTDPYNGHEYVDLGLPSGLLWATMNIGATSCEGWGDYFAWGEVTGYNDGKSKFYLDTYKWYRSTTTNDADGFEITKNGYTKYVLQSNIEYGYDGFYDNKAVLDLEDDAAHIKWGGAWRMPTNEEFDELRKKCTWSWAILNGKAGYKVTGPNGNYIFLPCDGYIKESQCQWDWIANGFYWSSSLYKSNQAKALSHYFKSDYMGLDAGDRFSGRSVRPVCPKP